MGRSSLYIYLSCSFSNARFLETFLRDDETCFSRFAETFGFVKKWREGGGGRNESGKVSREERKRERERNLQRANDESSNIFNLYVYIYIHIHL